MAHADRTPSRSSGGTGPPLRAIVAVVILVVVMIAAALVLVALTPAERRPDPVAIAIYVLPALVGGIPGMLAWLSASTAAKSLNGDFDGRVKGLVHDAMGERAAALPLDRIDDPPPAAVVAP